MRLNCAIAGTTCQDPGWAYGYSGFSVDGASTGLVGALAVITAAAAGLVFLGLLAGFFARRAVIIAVMVPALWLALWAIDDVRDNYSETSVNGQGFAVTFGVLGAVYVAGVFGRFARNTGGTGGLPARFGLGALSGAAALGVGVLATYGYLVRDDTYRHVNLENEWLRVVGFATLAIAVGAALGAALAGAAAYAVLSWRRRTRRPALTARPVRPLRLWIGMGTSFPLALVATITVLLAGGTGVDLSGRTLADLTATGAAARIGHYSPGIATFAGGWLPHLSCQSDTPGHGADVAVLCHPDLLISNSPSGYTVVFRHFPTTQARQLDFDNTCRSNDAAEDRAVPGRRTGAISLFCEVAYPPPSADRTGFIGIVWAKEDGLTQGYLSADSAIAGQTQPFTWTQLRDLWAGRF